MEKINLMDVEDGFYRIESSGATLHLFVSGGAITEVSVHNETPKVNIFTSSKMSKKTRKLGKGCNDCITLKVMKE